jgi:hypothetical protein
MNEDDLDELLDTENITKAMLEIFDIQGISYHADHTAIVGTHPDDNESIFSLFQQVWDQYTALGLFNGDQAPWECMTTPQQPTPKDGYCPKCGQLACVCYTPTPRTDAAPKYFFGDNRPGMSIECVPIELPRQLESELEEWKTIARMNEQYARAYEKKLTTAHTLIAEFVRQAGHKAYCDYPRYKCDCDISGLLTRAGEFLQSASPHQHENSK